MTLGRRAPLTRMLSASRRDGEPANPLPSIVSESHCESVLYYENVSLVAAGAATYLLRLDSRIL